MKRFSVLIIILLSSIILMADPPEVSKKFNKELSKHFDSESITTVWIKKISNSNDLFFKVFNGKKELGLVVLTSAKGRYENFDYMIVFNQELEIELIKILVYRSEYGAEITSKRWLSQFYSKHTYKLKYGNDIQAISGATFSASSLTNNVNRINKIVKEYNSTE
ncbi:MAG: FMN-binding protein [Bacteroidales bacterium]|nr:FMN-binding protein [Bacteroidales bacterium]